MYEFSVPMPYNKRDIDKLLSINKEIEKSKITSLYFGLPASSTLYTGFEQARNLNINNLDFDYWKDLIIHTKNRGIEVIYLLNNPAPIKINDINKSEQIHKLELLLKELKEINVKNLRVASVQLLSYLGRYYPEFNIYASTSLDYKTISEYQNFIMLHPEIKQIIPSHDVNKNYLLLKNLIKNYPSIEIEIMVNEGCMQGCPHRYAHEMYPSDSGLNNNLYLTGKYFISFCSHITDKYPFHSLTLNNNIYPWEIEEYSKIGINKFKLVGRDSFKDNMTSYINQCLLYLKGIDDFTFIKDIPITTFIHHLSGSHELQQLQTKKVRSLLPRIEHFKKYGHLCASRCGFECRYCYNCAEKIQKVFEKKQQEQRRKNLPVCIMN